MVKESSSTRPILIMCDNSVYPLVQERKKTHTSFSKKIFLFLAEDWLWPEREILVVNIFNTFFTQYYNIHNMNGPSYTNHPFFSKNLLRLSCKCLDAARSANSWLSLCAVFFHKSIRGPSELLFASHSRCIWRKSD